MKHQHHSSDQYEKNSLSLVGTVSLGTGVMIGAGIFALTGQVAELAGEWFPIAFVVSAIIAGFSAYSYIKLSNAYPSAGGIAMYLEKAYGKATMTAACGLLMYFSMVINESLVARTFGTYALQLFDVSSSVESWLVPLLGVLLLAFAFLVNILGNKAIQNLSFWMAFVKIAGLIVLGVGGVWVSGLEFKSIALLPSGDKSPVDLLGAVALGILAFKGFTTITNSGGEVKNPEKNVGRAIIISISICTVLYLLVSLAVGGNLSIDEIVTAKNYSLAQASRPAFGSWGLYSTVGFAIIATASGVIASIFAVSRMLAMLTEMKLVPHSHFGMSGKLQRHTLVYTVVIAMLLTVFFDLGRIASLGAIFYIVMDIAVHWGVLRHLRKELKANPMILITAIVLDVVVLVGLLWVKAGSDSLVLWAAGIGLVLVFAGEKVFLRGKKQT